MTAPASDLAVYTFGLGVGLRALPHAPLSGLKLLALPLEYVRCAETRYALQQLGVKEGDRVLDVGSPKLLSLYLAARHGVEVVATDLVDYFFKRYRVYADVALRNHRERYRMEAADGRSLPYADGSFDSAFAISTIQHIPGDGDSAAIRELGRVLRPGARLCLTTTWCDRGYMEAFTNAGQDEDAYWIPGSGERAFEWRAYDRPTLFSRVVNAGPFELEDLTFWGERRFRVEKFLLNRRRSKAFRWALTPAHFPLGRLFLERLGEHEPSHKKVACLTLRRK